VLHAFSPIHSVNPNSGFSGSCSPTTFCTRQTARPPHSHTHCTGSLSLTYLHSHRVSDEELASAKATDPSVAFVKQAALFGRSRRRWFVLHRAQHKLAYYGKPFVPPEVCVEALLMPCCPVLLTVCYSGERARERERAPTRLDSDCPTPHTSHCPHAHATSPNHTHHPPTTQIGELKGVIDLVTVVDATNVGKKIEIKVAKGRSTYKLIADNEKIARDW
jgi:hypothetical protein